MGEPEQIIRNPTPAAGAVGPAAEPTVGVMLQDAARLARPALVGGLQFVVAAALTLAVNVIAILVALPIGLATGNLVIALAMAEGSLLVFALLACLVLVARRRRGLGLGLIAGWAVGYVGVLAMFAIFIAIAVLAGLAFVALILLSTVAFGFG